MSSLLLQSHISLQQAGLQQTLSGFVADVSDEALVAFLTFLYSGEVPTSSRAVIEELRQYADTHHIFALRSACGKETPSLIELVESSLHSFALREAADRLHKSIEERPTPAEGEAMDLEESKQQPNIEEAMQRMREFREAAEERRQRVLQGLEQRIEGSGQRSEEAEQRSPPQEQRVEEVIEPRQPQDDASEAERRAKRAKILEALEHRK